MKTLEVESCDRIVDISQRNEYKKLNLSSDQKIQIGGLMQHMPSLIMAEGMKDAYILHFPEGVNGELMTLKSGFKSTPIQGADGKIVAHAYLEEMKNQMVIMQGFNAMAVVSGQYFLSEINNELKELSKSIDKILEFLYSNKKAELIAEISFTKYAYENYAAIMSHGEQKTATIGSLQSAKKVAMKDIEFYMSDLNDAATDTSNLIVSVEKAFRIKSCLELSMQLHVMSSLLEIYYSQNFDENYIQWIENDVMEYLGKCENRMLSCFSKLSASIHDYKNSPMKKINKGTLAKRVDTVIDSLGTGKESDMRKQFRATLRSMNKEMDYYIDQDVNVYLKTL